MSNPKPSERAIVIRIVNRLVELDVIDHYDEALAAEIGATGIAELEVRVGDIIFSDGSKGGYREWVERLEPRLREATARAEQAEAKAALWDIHCEMVAQSGIADSIHHTLDLAARAEQAEAERAILEAERDRLKALVELYTEEGGKPSWYHAAMTAAAERDKARRERDDAFSLLAECGWVPEQGWEHAEKIPARLYEAETERDAARAKLAAVREYVQECIERQFAPLAKTLLALAVKDALEAYRPPLLTTRSKEC